jgi:hypothetical protein
MSAKSVLRVQCIVILLLFLACPLYLPEKVQIKTEPAVYLPLGTPGSLQDHMDFSLNDLAESMPDISAGSEEIALYDFLGEYEDTRAFIIRIKLMEEDMGKYLGTDLEGPSSALPGMPDTEIPLNFPPITGTQKGFGLAKIQDILGNYDGLKFRSAPVYFYIQGPNRIFENKNVTVSLKVLDGDDPAAEMPKADLLSNQPVSRHEFPVFPDSADTPMTGTLSPKPETRFDLKDILNLDNPPANLDFKYEIALGNITVKSGELDAIREDFKTPLSAILVLVLPFQFTVIKDVPILSERNDDPEYKAISLLGEGEDLFGRNAADGESEGSITDILDRMQSLVIRVNIENNLGLAGYAPVYSAKPNPGDPNENLLGSIGLSGSSSIAVPKSKMANPFNIWVEMYLGEGQNFDIKRPAEDPEVLPLKLSLAVIVKTRINETF